MTLSLEKLAAKPLKRYLKHDGNKHFVIINIRNFNLIKLLLEINLSFPSRNIRSPFKVLALKIDINLLNQQSKSCSI